MKYATIYRQSAPGKEAIILKKLPGKRQLFWKNYSTNIVSRRERTAKGQGTTVKKAGLITHTILDQGTPGDGVAKQQALVIDKHAKL